MVTVDGSSGAVYDGVVEVARDLGGAPAEWADVWSRFQADRSGIPLVPGIAALEAAPPGEEAAVLVADIDLRSSVRGLWNDLEHLSESGRTAIAAAYVDRVRRALDASGMARVSLLGEDLPPGFFDAAVSATGDQRISIVEDAGGAVAITEALTGAAGDRRRMLPAVAQAVEAATDTAKFFGHTPAVRRAAMPDPGWRERWWSLLPEYGRFHQEFSTAQQLGEHEWLEIRPELVISPLLKSLVQPGFEMVPRAMGFSDLPPLYVKWIRCRYHFRADAFAAVWAAIVRATWDPTYMADLNRRVRRSYDQLGEVTVLFPTDDAELRMLTGERMVALMTSWWPRWVEFFALCWFIQAQGDDILYPFIEETVAANRAATGAHAEKVVVWPTAADLVLPTTPVLSGDYMASVGRLRSVMLERGSTPRTPRSPWWSAARCPNWPTPSSDTSSTGTGCATVTCSSSLGTHRTGCSKPHCEPGPTPRCSTGRTCDATCSPSGSTPAWREHRGATEPSPTRSATSRISTWNGRTTTCCGSSTPIRCAACSSRWNGDSSSRVPSRPATSGSSRHRR